MLQVVIWDLAIWDLPILVMVTLEPVIWEPELLLQVVRTGFCSCHFGKDQGKLRSVSCTSTVRGMAEDLCRIPCQGVPRGHYMGGSVDHSADYSMEGGSVDHCSEGRLGLSTREVVRY